MTIVGVYSRICTQACRYSQLAQHRVAGDQTARTDRYVRSNTVVGFLCLETWDFGLHSPQPAETHPTLLRYSPDPRLRQDDQDPALVAAVPPCTCTLLHQVHPETTSLPSFHLTRNVTSGKILAMRVMVLRTDTDRHYASPTFSRPSSCTSSMPKFAISETWNRAHSTSDEYGTSGGTTDTCPGAYSEVPCTN